jgi:protease-4
MRSFFKTFFAALLAVAIFTLIVFFFVVGYIGGLASKEIPKVESNSVLVLDLGQHFAEQLKENPFGILSREQEDVPGLYDVIRLLKKAGSDKNISGVYIIANINPNGFASSVEIRDALLDFKKSGKFVIAHGDFITQRAYGIANARRDM